MNNITLNTVGPKHLAGGAVLSRAANATGFPNRSALSLFSFECSTPDDNVLGDNVLGDNVLGVQRHIHSCLLVANQVMRYWQCRVLPLTTTRSVLNRLLDAVQPNSQYSGYLSPNEPHWQDAYYGANYPRLQRIKAAYDPINMFSKPFSPQAA